jgi:hypothetical protein
MDGTIRVRTAAWFATAVVLSVFATVLVMQAWRVDAAPGDTDSTFVPVTPCRLFDYRPGELPDGGKRTPLVAGSPATQQVTGTVGNCIIPDTGVVGVAMNVTVVDGTAQSNLRLYPADTAEPLVSNMNWKAGDSATANKVDVKLSSAGAIKLANFSGTVNVIGDIVGYYTDSSLKELAATVGGVDPAVLARIDALEASTATKANTADVNAALAMKLNGGPVTTSMGPGGWTTTDLSVLTQDAQGALASGDGFAYLALTGPETRGGVEYTLKDVTYCIKSVSDGGEVESVGVFSYDGTSGQGTVHVTIRDTPGCYTLTPVSTTRAGKAFMLRLEIVGGGAARVTLWNVTANWDTRAALGATS